MHGEEGEEEAQIGEGEVQPPHAFIQHAPRHFGVPVVNAAVDGEHAAAEQHKMEVADDEISVVRLVVERHGCQHHPADAAGDEHAEEAQAEQHGAREANLAAPDRPQPAEHLNAGGHGDDHRGDHEGDAQFWLKAGEHVVRPHREADERNGHAGKGDHAVAEDGLAAVHCQHLAEDAHARQHHDVYRRMAVEPEDVLPKQHIAAARRIKEGRTPHAIQQQQRQRAGQERRRHDGDEAGRQHRPAQQRHLPQAHAFRAHVQDGDDEVDAAQDGRQAQQVNAHGPHRLALVAEQGGKRRVARPAGFCLADEVAHQQEHASRGNEPEGQRVQPREGHILCAQLQRHNVVGDCAEHGDDPQEDHHCAVNAEQLVVGCAAGHQIQFRRQQFPADRHRQRTANEEEDKGRDAVLHPDDLVVNRPAQVIYKRRQFALGLRAFTQWDRDGCHTMPFNTNDNSW